jgi:NADH:ubiquinone oxidoreductase subunit 6 (subunit J)
VHLILSFIFIIFCFSFLLFLSGLTFFAVLILIIYIGAVVVLFLFVMMILNLKHAQFFSLENPWAFFKYWESIDPSILKNVFLKQICIFLNFISVVFFFCAAIFAYYYAISFCYNLCLVSGIGQFNTFNLDKSVNIIEFLVDLYSAYYFLLFLLLLILLVVMIGTVVITL